MQRSVHYLFVGLFQVPENDQREGIARERVGECGGPCPREVLEGVQRHRGHCGTGIEELSEPEFN